MSLSDSSSSNAFQFINFSSGDIGDTGNGAGCIRSGWEFLGETTGLVETGLGGFNWHLRSEEVIAGWGLAAGKGFLPTGGLRRAET